MRHSTPPSFLSGLTEAMETAAKGVEARGVAAHGMVALDEAELDVAVPGREGSSEPEHGSAGW